MLSVIGWRRVLAETPSSATEAWPKACGAPALMSALASEQAMAAFSTVLIWSGRPSPWHSGEPLLGSTTLELSVVTDAFAGYPVWTSWPAASAAAFSVDPTLASVAP